MAVGLLAELRGRGVVLSIDPERRLAYDALAGVLSDELLGRMRTERDGLLAERFLVPMPWVICPWCRADCDMVEIPSGLRCDRCGRDAWRFLGGSIVRCDWIERQEVVSSDRHG